MSLEIGIKRPDKKAGIERILLGIDAQEAETAGRVEVSEAGYDYKPLLAKLEEYLNLRARKEYIAQTVLDTLDTVLTPEQIYRFLYNTTTLEQHRRYVPDAGAFISRLIQKSYNAGNNNFTLNLENTPALHYIGVGITGTKEKPVTITITGKTGESCGFSSENCTFNVEATGDYCGWSAKNCIFNNQNTGSFYGHEAQNCTFNVEATGDDCGNGAENCTFNAEKTGNKCGWQATNSVFNMKETGYDCWFGIVNCTVTVQRTEDSYRENAKHSTFRTSNPEILQQMLAEVPEGNRITFIDEKGEEKVMREYDEPPR